MVNGIRFIIGNKCNYNCFYCHHEGVFSEEQEPEQEFKDKIDIIYKYCEEHNVTSLSVTGGEPLLYIQKLKYILDKFNDKKYRFSINTNAILIDRYVDYFNNLNSNLEFHINVSSLDSKTHQIISGTKLYNKLMSNLELLTDKNFKVCLNTIFLKGVNDHEVYDFIDYCEDRNFVLRLLQYLPNSEEDRKYVITDKDLHNYIKDLEISDITSYGIYKCKVDDYKFEFVKNLCCDKLCERCKQNTYIQFTPELNIKKCMMKDTIEMVNYNDYQSFADLIEKIEKEI